VVHPDHHALPLVAVPDAQSVAVGERVDPGIEPADRPRSSGPGQPSPTPSPSEARRRPRWRPSPTSRAVFTQPSAQLGSKSLSFSGLRGISVVTVPLADGSRTTALKLEADRITISDSASVRHDTGPILTTTADTMTLDGHSGRLHQLAQRDASGRSCSRWAPTPPPAEGLDSMFGVTLGLVGSTADSITYTNTVQHLSE
jgi:hypothetical protein